MATYAIGDIQGCYDELCDLLAHIDFQAQQDQLWLAGDLVNRGAQSLAVLRFLMELPRAPVVVLGNHDLHLLAVASGAVALNTEDTIGDVLTAEDRESLCHWLSQQSLLHHDDQLGFTMVHAGIPPQWDLMQAKLYAAEVEAVLHHHPSAEFYKALYGNQPQQWSEQLEGMARVRYIVNALTRMRLCHTDGRLNLSYKGNPHMAQEDGQPWFNIAARANQSLKIIFGHWAALEGQVETKGIYALDTGCVWGGRLTALRLEDEQWFSVPAR